MIGLGERHDIDCMRKGGIYHDIKITQVSGLDTRLIVGLFIETGNPSGRADLKVKLLNSVWDMLI